MKRFLLRLSLAALTTILISSCSKWLDVQPTDRVSDETLFSGPNGFRTALNGIYQQAAKPELYGRQLTWGLFSVMGQDYYAFRLSTEYQKAVNSDFTDASLISTLSGTWGASYTAIANCNKLISEIDKKEDGFFPAGRSERNMIKGEAIAMRALLHFDMVRLFTKSPVKNDLTPIVPYQEVYPAHFAEALSTPDIMKKIIRDLNDAQSLVAENDTITNRLYLSGGLSYTLNGVSGPNNLFFSYRMNRLNYVAIHGLLARAYLYIGDVENAKKEAYYVYKEFGPAGKRWFTFTSESNTNSVNRYPKMADDILLAFYDLKLINNINSYKGTSYTMQLNTNITSILPANERDYRRNLVTTDNLSYKWLESAAAAANVPQQNLILPVLRLSEMYYIYSECLYRQGNPTDALKILNEIRTARGKSSIFSDSSEDGYYAELLMEYRRDFMVEGQTIFAHKRLNKAMQIGTVKVEVDGKFTPPIPEGER